MRLSPTLSVYIGRHFLVGFFAVFAALLVVIMTFDIVELLRRAAPRPDVTFDRILELAFLRLPSMGQKAFPFAALLGAMLVFWRLSRTNELVVTRASGVSAWQFLLPVLLLAALLGVVRLAVTNPLASAMLARYERLEYSLLRGQESALALAATGLWLRQADDRGQSVIHAAAILQQGNEVDLKNVIVFRYEGTDRFIGRIDAETARLDDGFWHLRNAWVMTPERSPQFEREFWLETDLTLSRIQDSFAPPETMSFWSLPSFIGTLEAAGFSAVRHRLHFHALLSSPLLMCAMVLIAATFTLRHARRTGTTFVVATGVLTGFVVHFFSDLVFALGLSDGLPVTLAAWTPSGVALLLGLATLLHLEDG